MRGIKKTIEKLTFEQFNSVFEQCEKLPQTKAEYMKALYNFYNYGKKNAIYEFKHKFNQTFFND